MMSAGCLAILKEQYSAFRAHTLDFVKRHGRAWLKVDSNGNASITADRPDDPVAKSQDEKKKTSDTAKALNKPVEAGKGLGDVDVAPAPVRDAWGNQLGTTTPTRTGGSAGGLGQQTPTRGSSRNNDAGSGNLNVHGPIHITVPGAGDPKAVASAVNQEFRSRAMARAADIDPTAV